MKKIAYWSHQNPWKARIIIAVSHLALWSGAIFTGIQLFMEDITVSQLSIKFMAIVFAAAYVFYPIRNTKESLFKYSFRRRIRHDLILLASSAWIVTGSVNQFAYKPVTVPARDIPVTMMVAGDLHGIGARATKLGIKEFMGKLREFRKELKQTFYAQKSKYKERPTGDKVVMIFLTILGAIALFFGIGSLACSLACSGNGALAWIVLLGGTFGIIILTVRIIRSIIKKKNTETPSAAPVV